MDAAETDYHDRLQRALGRDFTLGALIGRGGFGDVYAARDHRLERDVAVKSLRHDLFPTVAVLARFQREARAVAKLRHPNILPIYAVGEGDGIAFMIMPLIQGESLAALLARHGTLPADEAARIATDIARALDAAHRHGIVHRDVKPENIFLEGQDRHVLLADFGIAKAAAPDDVDLTSAGLIIGSPRYMSPEQSTGDRDVDGRSDIYSLGAVAYEMISGRPPYEAGSVQQLLVQRLTTDPLPLEELVRTVGTGLSDVVMRCLVRNPDERWRNATDLAAALQSAAGIVATTPSGGEGETPSWLARRGPLVAGLAYSLFYVDIAVQVADTAGNRGATAMLAPIATMLKFGLPLLLAELPTRMMLARLGGGSWTSMWRAAFAQPRWWQSWYPPALRHPSNVWHRMPVLLKTLRTILAIDVVVLPLALPLYYFVPQLVDVAHAGNHPLPLVMRLVIGAAVALKPLLPASIAAIVAGVAYVSARRRLSPLRVVECLLTWRRDRWSATEVEALLSSGELTPRSA